jgi:dienelactone hydrolase
MVLKLHQQRKASKSLGFWFFPWPESLSSGYLWRGELPKDNAEAARKNLVTIKRTTRNIKTNFISIRSINSCWSNPDNIVVIGLFWGTGALEAARGHLNVKGVVSFHGGLGRDASRPTEPITTKVLICHGEWSIRIKRRNYRFPARNARHKCWLANDLLR